MGMKITEEMIAEDEKRWGLRDVVMELGYCGNNMCNSNSMTNLDIRFYAYIMRKAHEMLKAQEPRVMTLEEVKSSVGNDMYLEISTRTDEIPYITAATLDSAGQKGVVFYCDHFNFVAYNRRLYGWRCWTSRPTDEQREATPWQ